MVVDHLAMTEAAKIVEAVKEEIVVEAMETTVGEVTEIAVADAAEATTEEVEEATTEEEGEATTEEVEEEAELLRPPTVVGPMWKTEEEEAIDAEVMATDVEATAISPVATNVDFTVT